MCRVAGSVAREPVSIRHELLHAENPLIRQSVEHDSGWGMAAYPRAEGEEPRCVRFPEAAHADGDFRAATDTRGRIINAHLRRATIGGLAPENTHPFCLGSFSFSHNGTVLHFRRLIEHGVAEPRGRTDSEHMFNLLMHDFDDGDPVRCLRRLVETVVERSPFSALNFLFSDGERLFAYRLGVFELHWLRRPGQLLVASERMTGEAWHTVQQDVLLVVDPADVEEPHAERLVGDRVVERADIRPLSEGAHLRGRARGALAAARAERLTSSEPR